MERRPLNHGSSGHHRGSDSRKHAASNIGPSNAAIFADVRADVSRGLELLEKMISDGAQAKSVLKNVVSNIDSSLSKPPSNCQNCGSNGKSKNELYNAQSQSTSLSKSKDKRDNHKTVVAHHSTKISSISKPRTDQAQKERQKEVSSKARSDNQRNSRRKGKKESRHVTEMRLVAEGKDSKHQVVLTGSNSQSKNRTRPRSSSSSSSGSRSSKNEAKSSRKDTVVAEKVADQLVNVGANSHVDEKEVVTTNKDALRAKLKEKLIKFKIAKQKASSGQDASEALRAKLKEKFSKFKMSWELLEMKRDQWVLMHNSNTGISSLRDDVNKGLRDIIPEDEDLDSRKKESEDGRYLLGNYYFIVRKGRPLALLRYIGEQKEISSDTDFPPPGFVVVNLSSLSQAQIHKLEELGNPNNTSPDRGTSEVGSSCDEGEKEGFNAVRNMTDEDSPIRRVSDEVVRATDEEGSLMTILC